jgi:hypothetical protein
MTGIESQGLHNDEPLNSGYNTWGRSFMRRATVRIVGGLTVAGLGLGIATVAEATSPDPVGAQVDPWGHIDQDNLHIDDCGFAAYLNLRDVDLWFDSPSNYEHNFNGGNPTQLYIDFQTQNTLYLEDEPEVVVPGGEVLYMDYDKYGRKQYTLIKAEDDTEILSRTAKASVECMTGFTDVPETSFYSDFVVNAFIDGITTGTSSTAFSPEDKVTREQIAAFLGRTYEHIGGIIDEDTPHHNFTDVDEQSYAGRYISWMKDVEITTSESTYSPNDNLTRGQMAALVARFMEYVGVDIPAIGGDEFPPFEDVDLQAFYAKPVAIIYNAGITTGTSPTEYSPNDDVDRGQMVTFLGRMLKLDLPLR